ncbi:MULTISPECIES: hypothetical protein [unclassified Bradyrhizobium]|uniref:hypothetical protein n=1 Tax=unclassified Bradyrhizobium TaxID=2631580 RepID=UPI002917123E|nr:MULTISPECIES: hypothetical protein [unclassified Bradyrhizobium]
MAKQVAKNGAMVQIKVNLLAGQMLSPRAGERQKLVKAKVREALEQILAELKQEEHE